MKRFKPSFALTIATLIISITITARAGKRTITRCFTTVLFTNGTNDFFLNQSYDCHIAEIIIPARPYVKSANFFYSLASGENCPPSDGKYCCVRLTETDDETASLLDLGEGEKRYYIENPTVWTEWNTFGDIFCRPEP